MTYKAYSCIIKENRKGERKMKRILSVLTSAALLSALTFTASANALSEDSSWRYGLYQDGTATITAGESVVFQNGGNVAIPSEIDGHTVVEIGWYSFSGATGLFTVEIPETVLLVGNYAFENCYGLNTVCFDSNTVSTGTEIIGEGAFSNCYGLENINFPVGLKTIGDKAFINCSAVNEIDIPYGVEAIGGEAFKNCSSLTSINIPITVNELGDDIFDGCPFTLAVYYEGTSAQWDEIKKDKEDFEDISIIFASYELPDEYLPYGNSEEYNYMVTENGTAELGSYSGKGGDIIIPSEIDGYTVSAIGAYCFSDCEDITSVEIPSSVTYIGTGAFRRCGSLTRAVIAEGTLTIDKTAFADCTRLKYVTIPSTVTEICPQAFENCSSLTEIVIPDSVFYIGDHAFAGCEELEKITMGNSVSQIGEYAFSGCESLSRAEIPGGVSVIERSVFQNCDDLEEIIIPSSVTEIESYAFYNCSDLEIVYYGGSSRQWEAVSISSNNRSIKNAKVIYDYDPETYKPTGSSVAIILCALAALVPFVVVIALVTRRKSRCPECGAQVEKNSKFCGGCGKEL